MRDDVVAIVKRELGMGPSAVEQAAEGLYHETYRVRCDGDGYVVQIADAGGEQETALRRGLSWYVALRESDIPVPEVVTETVGEYDGSVYSVVEELPGETLERDVSPETTRAAGRWLAKIHAARRFERAGCFTVDETLSVREFSAGSFSKHVQRHAAASVRTLTEHGLDDAGLAVSQVVDQLGGVVPDAFQPVLCHGDYSPDNVLFADRELTGVIDFDFAFAGHAQYEVAKAGNAFWMHDPGADWDVRATLFAGYEDMTELDDSFAVTEPLYRAVTLAETISSLLEMDALSDDERAFYAEAIQDAVDRID